MILIVQTALLRADQEDRIAQSCTNDEISIFYDNIESLTDRPLTAFATRADVSDSCKYNMAGDLLDAISLRSQQGLCLNNWCESMINGLNTIFDATLSTTREGWCAPTDEEQYEATAEELEMAAEQETQPCVLFHESRDIFEQADALIGEAVLSQVEHIENKISQGLIPVCLLPPECKKNGSDCRRTLLKMWWSETLDAPDQQRINENWIEAGGFTHLLLGQALVCGTMVQIGYTCGIYSGASLMSHYCATPARNPGAKIDSEPPSGPGGFKCADPNNFLQSALETGAWEAELCLTDLATGQETCRPAADNPKETEEKAILLQMQQASCQSSSTILNKSLECRQLREKLRATQKSSADLYSKSAQKPLPKDSYIKGSPGVWLDKLAKTYEKFDFRALRIEGTHTGWSVVLATIDHHHPIQTSIYVDDWGKYWGAGNSMPHAVVIVGHFIDDQGFQRILIQDSNLPGRIKVFKAKDIEDEYINRAEGSISLCAPRDQRSGCVKAWTNIP